MSAAPINPSPFKARLSELAHIVKQGVVDGWASVSASTTLELDEWIAT